MQLFELLFGIVHILSVSTQDTLYVRPNGSSHPDCPDNRPCFTLDQYIEENNFTTGSTFIFLSGNHTPQTRMHLTNIGNVTLRGEDGDSDINIICQERTTIRCDNVTNLNIEGLTFIFKSGQWYTSVSALHLFATNITISNSTFLGNAIASENSAIFSNHGHITIINCLFEQNRGSRGGAISALNGSILDLSGNTFTRNTALQYSGGAISISYSLLLLRGTPQNKFSHNSALYRGGAVYCNKCNISMTGINVFYNNYLNIAEGGAMYIEDGSLSITGVACFMNNTASVGGGAIFLYNSDAIFRGDGSIDAITEHNSAFIDGVSDCETLSNFNDTNIFINNTAHDNFFSGQGGAIFVHEGNLLLNAINIFTNNSAEKGGAIFIKNVEGTISFSGVNIFTNNIALYGGALAADSSLLINRYIDNVLTGKVSFNGSTMFKYNKARFGGGAIDVYYNIISFDGNTAFLSNTGSGGDGGSNGTGGGGGINLKTGKLLFNGVTMFTSNSAIDGGGIHSRDGSISLRGTTISFISNTADRNGGALYSSYTMIFLDDTVVFSNNSAQNGGAMYLRDLTSLNMLNIKRNALYTRIDASYNSATEYGGVIYHKDIPTPEQCSSYDVTKDDDVLPQCFLQRKFSTYLNSYHNSAGRDGNFLYGGLLDKCKYIEGNADFPIFFRNDPNAIASETFRLCLSCFDKERICFGSRRIEIQRGQTFTLPIQALGEWSINSSALVTAIVSKSARLDLNQSSQTIPEYCTNISFNLYSIEDNEELILYPDGPCRDTGLARVVINVKLLPCPDAFIQSGDTCICEERLQAYNATCTIGDDISITRNPGSKFWMSALYNDSNDSYVGLILYHTCPPEYCKTETVITNLDSLDDQCDLNRSGVLCGACASNHSLMLGSSRCAICSNHYLTLLLPFALAGIALVIFITFMRITVATGMINSIILYANFVQVNRKLFFPINERNILTVFIAWLNLDLGFETCFFDGLNAYTQTWLQFAFPIYVWMLISLIILSSRYSITISKLIGSNPIAVLATLLLMSYTKILNIIIEVYSTVNLDYPNERKVTVWLKDGNIPNSQSLHLLLIAVTSLVLIFIFLPYTLLLLLGHHVYHYSHKKYLRWFNRIKPLLDSYYGPYKINTRYWTGFLLLVRCILYIVFSVNSLGDTNKSLLTIIITFTGIGFIFSGRIYRHFYNDIIESSIHLNLVILSAGTLVEVNRAALSYTLVGIVFATTIGIIVYQFHLLYISKKPTWLKIKSKIPYSKKTLKNPPQNSPKTSVQLRESLLESKTVI